MSQALFDFHQHPADPQTGFAIGWDYARHGVAPPAALLHDGSPVRAGFGAARSRFAGRALRPTPAVRQWLALRTEAWLHGRVFESEQLNANYLRQIAAEHCPVTREVLCSSSPLVRVLHDAAYAAGNVAQLSVRAAAAKHRLSWRQALAAAQMASASDAVNRPFSADLSADEWRRLAVLMSFVTPMSHADAAVLPLCVLPPNRLRLLNPIQGLQLVLTQRLAKPGWTPALRQWAELLGSSPARHELHRFASALLPRLLSAAPEAAGLAHKHALADAWKDERVNRRWQQLALALTEPQVLALLANAERVGWAGRLHCTATREQATEGWALDSLGLLPAAAPTATRECREPATPTSAAAVNRPTVRRLPIQLRMALQ